MTGNKYCLGKKLSDEHKQKIGAAHKGFKHSTESKEKIRLANIGKKRSAETKEKMRNSHQKKAVYCFELNKVFDGVRTASRELSLYHNSIILCCNGKLKTTGGYHFSYYTGDSK